MIRPKSPQDLFYWRLWGMARKTQADLDRKALHAELGLPESHAHFSQRDFDRFKSRCLAIAQPANLRDQVKTAAMPETRRREFIRHILTVLGEGDAYADATLARMHRNARQENTTWATLATFATAGDADLERLTIAMKMEAKRRWKTKDDLLEAIWTFWEGSGLDEATAMAAALQALHRPHLGRGLKFMGYEDLLVVFSALQRVSRGESVGAVAEVKTEEEPAEIDIPF